MFVNVHVGRWATWKLQIVLILYLMIRFGCWLLLNDQIGIQLAFWCPIANILMLILGLGKLLQTDFNYRNAAVDIKVKAGTFKLKK